MLSVQPSLKIVATLLAKNEEDIIATTLEHHIEQGVSIFIVTDNHSSDRTKEIVSKYPEVVELIDEPETDHNQSKWVTRMARIACKFNPDWIIHLDADELWCHLCNLREIQAEAVGCERMYLHPPTGESFSVQSMRYYLDMDHLPVPQECKIAHRPNPDVTVTHGNHDVLGVKTRSSTIRVSRHHFPIRSYSQWERKTVEGCLALRRRNVTCERWENWYNLWLQEKLPENYARITDIWKNLVKNPEISLGLSELLNMWCTDEMMNWFMSNATFPKIKEWI